METNQEANELLNIDGSASLQLELGLVQGGASGAEAYLRSIDDRDNFVELLFFTTIWKVSAFDSEKEWLYMYMTAVNRREEFVSENKKTRTFWSRSTSIQNKEDFIKNREQLPTIPLP